MAPESVNGAVMLTVALVRVCVDLGRDLADRTGERAPPPHGLNLEDAFAHVLTDLYAFAATAVAAVMVLAAGLDRRSRSPRWSSSC